MSDYLKIELIGRDGSYWCVAGPGAGKEGVTLSPNAQNLIDTPVKTLWTPGPFGEQYAGKRVQRREMVLPFQVGDTAMSPESWATIDSRFRWAWDYDQECTLKITTDDGTRWLKLRLFEAPKSYDIKDPFLTADNPVIITATAEFPYWQSDSDEFVWETLNPEDRKTFFVANNGDVPVWLKWTFTAPGLWQIPDFSWGNDMYARGEQDRGRTLWLPELVAGEHISVDSDPRVQTVIAANDAPVQHRWKGNDLLYPLMPGESGDIPIRIMKNTAGAACKLTVKKWFSRPWSRPMVIKVGY